MTVTPPTTHRPDASWRITAVACALAYAYLAHLSQAPGGGTVIAFLAAHFAVVAVIVVAWLALPSREISIREVLFWAIIFRGIGVVFGAPILEDDPFRYLLDGCVFVATGTPFGIAPAQLFDAQTATVALSPECRALLSRVNNPDLPTIYAPVLQLVFAAANLVAGVQIKALQAAFSLADLALVALLCRHAAPRFVLLYAWCPLLVKETAFNAHPDVIAIALLFAAMHFRVVGKPVAVAVLLAAAVASKAFAILLLPFLLWRLPLRYGLLCLMSLLILYAPFLLQGASDLSTLNIFLRHWQFNASVFLFIANLTDSITARVICYAIFAACYALYFYRWTRKKSPPSMRDFAAAAVITFGVFLFLSPVVNAWYLLWLLPFAALQRWLTPWAWAAVVPLSYIIGLHFPASQLGVYEVAGWAVAMQVTVIVIAVAVDGYRHRNATE